MEVILWKIYAENANILESIISSTERAFQKFWMGIVFIPEISGDMHRQSLVCTLKDKTNQTQKTKTHDKEKLFKIKR